MALTTECPDLEELAAYVDGTLDAEQRARVTAHLAACDDCFEMFAGVARYQEDEHAAAEEAAGADPAASPGGPVRPFEPPPSLPARRRARRRGWFVLPGGRTLPAWPAAALAAVLALAVGWAVFHAQLQPPPVLEMAGLLAQNSAAVKAAPWSQAKRGGTASGETASGENANSENRPPSYYKDIRFGVRKLDLAMALAARGRSGLYNAAWRMCGLLHASDFTPPDATDQCNRIAEWRDPAGNTPYRQDDVAPKRGDDRALVLAATSLLADKDLEEGFDLHLVELGSWAEACRLGTVAAAAPAAGPRRAAQTEEVLDFLRSRATRHLLTDVLASHSSDEDRVDLDDEGRRRLSEVQQEIAKLPSGRGPGLDEALAEIDKGCTSILSHYDDD